MKTKYKHIHFEKNDYDDTSWFCFNNKSRGLLAIVAYYKPWRKFAVVEFDESSVFDEKCLLDIIDFLGQLNHSGAD